MAPTTRAAAYERTRRRPTAHTTNVADNDALDVAGGQRAKGRYGRRLVPRRRIAWGIVPREVSDRLRNAPVPFGSVTPFSACRGWDKASFPAHEHCQLSDTQTFRPTRRRKSPTRVPFGEHDAVQRVSPVGQSLPPDARTFGLTHDGRFPTSPFGRATRFSVGLEGLGIRRCRDSRPIAAQAWRAGSR